MNYEWCFDEIRDKCCPVGDIEKGAQIRDVPANMGQLATLLETLCRQPGLDRRARPGELIKTRCDLMTSSNSKRFAW